MPVLLSALLLAVSLRGKGDASIPVPRLHEYDWMSTAHWRGLHEGFCKRAREGKIEIVFLGDSITEGWPKTATWKETFEPMGAVAFGISGDTVQNVHWRILNGNVEGLRPKAVVLMAGTNNLALDGDEPPEVARGIAATVKTLRKKLPDSQILLLAVLPRDEQPGSSYRKKTQAINVLIAPLGKQKNVRFLDAGPKFLSPDGTISRDLMPDFLHPGEKGYRLWAESIGPVLKELTGK